MSNIPVIAVVGPTASGKSALAVELALHFRGEIISADSMQIYQGMNIATAKSTEQDKRGIVHHMLDIIPVGAKFCVAEYVSQAKEIIFDVHKRGKMPIIVGGTGLYVDSLLNNIEFIDFPDNSEIRKKLTERLMIEGATALYEELKKIDETTAKALHPNNTGRVLRALEVYYLTGQTMTEIQRLSRVKPSPFCTCYIGLAFKDRQKLYHRIDMRAEEMIEKGLLLEAKEYSSLSKDKTAIQAIGYKELFPYFNNEITFYEAFENLKRETRRYAKRQITWFKRNNDINWLYVDDYADEACLIKASKEIVREFVYKRSRNEE